MHREKYSHFANNWRSIFLYNRIVNEQVTMHFLFRSKKKEKRGDQLWPGLDKG